jgi:hypothetical protein
MRSLRKRIIAVVSGVFAAASIFAHQAIAADNGSPNTLAHYDLSLVKAMDAYGPLFSQYIPRSNAETAAPGDFVENIQAPDGGDVRVLVKAPAPAEPGKILKVAPIASGETANNALRTPSRVPPTSMAQSSSRMPTMSMSRRTQSRKLGPSRSTRLRRTGSGTE